MSKLIQLINLTTISDDGKLSIGQYPDIPFEIKRIYYIYDCSPGLLRGKHAHHETKQILFCLRGSVKLILDSGKEKETVILNKPHVGILLDKMVWHNMDDIDKDTFMLVVASKEYDAKDYIRNYSEFIKLTK